MGEKLTGYPQAVPEGPGASITSVRHGPKDTSRLDSLEHPQGLTEAGKEAVRAEAREYFEFIVHTVPRGGIVSLSSSTISRAQETKDIFVETIRECARNNAASSVVLIKRYRKNGVPHSDAFLRNKTRDATLRYVVTDEIADEDLGYRRDENDNITPFNGAMEFFKDEHLVSMIWSTRPDELPALIHHLHEEMKRSRPTLSPEEEQQLRDNIILHVGQYIEHSKRTPEELVANQLEAIERSVTQAFRVRPERRHVLHFVQHAPGLSFLALELFGRGISFQSYHELGDYQHYLEGLSFDVDTEGRVLVVDFRNNRSLIEPISLSSLVATLYQKSDERKEAWARYFGSPLQQAA